MRKRLSEKLWENSVKKVTYMAAMALQIYRNKESNASLNYLSIKLVHTYIRHRYLAQCTILPILSFTISVLLSGPWLVFDLSLIHFSYIVT